ncbi:MAG TPA: preprotein translocase subunit SecE [Candidatus Obscuribacter sp.]|nr:preprotein translocase subunit SecE [Candidatus Obscuribacter sp.]
MATTNEDDGEQVGTQTKAGGVKMVESKSEEQDKQPKKNPTEKEPSGFAGAAQFLREVAIEHRKITWPDRRQIVRETWSVIFLDSAITVMVLGIDWVLGHVIFGPLEHWARIHGAGVGRG